jgi:flagellar biosynthesis anti-sigma factor FlgM
MKITRRAPGGLPGIGLPGAIGDAAAPDAPDGPGRGDRVDISAEARLRARLRREIGDLDAVASARVAELRAQIEAGTYHRSPQAVAERFLADVAADLLA